MGKGDSLRWDKNRQYRQPEELIGAVLPRISSGVRHLGTQHLRVRRRFPLLYAPRGRTGFHRKPRWAHGDRVAQTLASSRTGRELRSQEGAKSQTDHGPFLEGSALSTRLAELIFPDTPSRPGSVCVSRQVCVYVCATHTGSLSPASFSIS